MTSAIGGFSIGVDALGIGSAFSGTPGTINRYTSPVDICNRALQLNGVARISGRAWPPTEDSQNAAACYFVYDKLREAELRRNVWATAIRRAVLRPLDVTSMWLNPPVWDVATVYNAGSIVGDNDGRLWQSGSTYNIGSAPGQTAAWYPYFNTLMATPFDGSDNSGYFAGELVYEADQMGNFNVFVSLVNGNTDDPSVAQTWATGGNYSRGAVVTYNGVTYQSGFDQNIGNTPGSSAAPWTSTTTYSAAAQVAGSDGLIYTSIAGGNINHDPTLDVTGTYWAPAGQAVAWSTLITNGTGSLQWTQLYGAQLQGIDIIYPATCGPSSQFGTANVFILPNGFMREAPPDPKGGLIGPLGAAGTNFTNDWEFEGSFIISSQPGSMILRFVADITAVPFMDAMFCEGLAKRIGYEISEELTQSTSKKTDLARAYEKFMGDARQVNAIETGFVAPEEDEWLTVRF